MTRLPQHVGQVIILSLRLLEHAKHLQMAIPLVSPAVFSVKRAPWTSLAVQLSRTRLSGLALHTSMRMVLGLRRLRHGGQPQRKQRGAEDLLPGLRELQAVGLLQKQLQTQKLRKPN